MTTSPNDRDNNGGYIEDLVKEEKVYSDSLDADADNAITFGMGVCGTDGQFHDRLLEISNDDMLIGSCIQNIPSCQRSSYISQDKSMWREIPKANHTSYDLRKEFENEAMRKAGRTSETEVVPGKLPGNVYVFNKSGKTHETSKELEALVKKGAIICNASRPTQSNRDDITQHILQIMEQRNLNEIPYTELGKIIQYPLTFDLPIDDTRLADVYTTQFHGIRRLSIVQEPTPLPDSHFQLTISLRKLSPIVHGILSEYEKRHDTNRYETDDESRNVTCPLDYRFLYYVRKRIYDKYPSLLDAERPRQELASRIAGEGEPKPLEHLVACVPGIEVVWLRNVKHIRKLEVNKPEETSAACAKSKRPAKKDKQAKNEQQTAEQLTTKILTNILKVPEHAYMTFTDLKKEFMANREAANMAKVPNIEDYVKNHVKHFQVLGEWDNVVVTLSHRAQIKRITNDIARLLRPQNLKCVSTRELPRKLVELWRHTRPIDTFNVSHFGVCYLDDLIVTIPQHWSVYCSEYIGQDGRLMMRYQGNDVEDIPCHVDLGYRGRPDSLASCIDPSQDNFSLDETSEENLDGYGVLHMWVPIRPKTECEARRLSILRQQVLNMCRGDPSASNLKKLLEPLILNHADSEGSSGVSELLKRHEIACLRSNTTQSTEVTEKRQKLAQKYSRSGRDHIPKRHQLPCNFVIGFNQFIPTFHHVFNTQATTEFYGGENLFELFDALGDILHVTHHEANLAELKLTGNARRDVLERRLIYILRSKGMPIEMRQLLLEYFNEPTMRPYYDEFEIEQAARECSMIHFDSTDRGQVVRLGPMFSLKQAMAENSYTANVLAIFMTSFKFELTFNQVEKEYKARFGHHIPPTAFRILETRGALRRTRIAFKQVPAEDITFDLQDICRIVRNLIHQMNDDPDRLYYLPNTSLENDRLLGMKQEYSLHTLVEFAGDSMMPKTLNLDKIMRDFSEYFDEEQLLYNGHTVPGFKLRKCVVVAVPTEEDKDKAKRRLMNRGRPPVDR